MRLGALATTTVMIAMALPICARAAVSECADPQRADRAVAKALPKGADRTRFLDSYMPAVTQVGDCEQLGAVGAARVVVQQRRDQLHQRLATLGWRVPPTKEPAESRVMAVYETTIHELGADYEAAKDYVSLVVLNRSTTADARVQVELAGPTGPTSPRRTVTLTKTVQTGQVVVEDWELTDWLGEKGIEIADLRMAGSDGQFRSVPFQVAEPEMARAENLQRITSEDEFLSRVEARLTEWQSKHPPTPTGAVH